MDPSKPATANSAGQRQARSDALERVSDGVVSLNDDLQYTYVNTSAADILGTDAESLLGESVWDVFPDARGTKAQDAIERAIETDQTTSFERYNQELDKWWEVRVHPDDTGITIVFSDITERKERLYQLERADTLFQNAQDGLFVVDVEDGGETFRVDRVNRTYEALTGASAGELEGKSIREIADERDSAAIREKYLECVNGRKSLEYEEYLSAFDDGAWWETRIEPVLVDDEVTQIVGSTRNVTDRKERITRLRKFEQMVQHTGHAVFFTDVHGEIEYVNPEFERLTGYTAAEALGTTPDLLSSGEHEDAFFADLWETVLDGNVWSGEIVNERKDGTRFVANHTIAPVADDSGAVTNFVAIYDDITERKEREQEIRTHLVQAQEVGNVGSWYLKLGNNELQWSDECYRIFGLEPGSSMTYERFLEMVHPEDREKVKKAWREALEGKAYEIEHRIVVDGEIRWVHETAEVEFDTDGEPESGIGVVRDITNQVQKEREIRAQKRRYESLFESIGGAIVVTDVDGRIRNCNSGFTDLFGYDLNGIDGDGLDTIVDDGGDVDPSLEQTTVPGDSLIVDYRKNSGQVFPGESRISTLRTHDGDLAGHIIHVIDVSNRQKNREQLQVLGRVLRHNIKNDMNIVIGQAELIKDQGSNMVRPRAEKILEKSHSFIELAENQRRIVDVLTDQNGIDTVDLVPMIERSVAEIQKQYPDATLQTDLTTDCQAITARAIDEAIQELLQNAIIHSDQERPAVDVQLRCTDSIAELKIRDDGPGIPDQEWKVLTEEGEINPLHHGTGLGLWFVNQVVRHSNGTLAFDASGSGGSTVVVRLPADYSSD